jgi:uncharacterized protein involved in response to NO
MEFFLPSILLMLVACLISMFFVPNFTPAVIAMVAIALMVFGVYNHYITFSDEYNIMQWADAGKQIAPTLITGLVIVLMGGYIIYMFSSGGMPRLPMPPNSIPPPSTATNPMTEGIGNAMEAMGANVNRNRSANRPNNGINSARRAEAEAMLEQAA